MGLNSIDEMPASVKRKSQAPKLAVPVAEPDRAETTDRSLFIHDVMRLILSSPEGLSAQVRRTIASMSLPPWDRHDWPTLTCVIDNAAKRLTNPEYVGAICDYYGSKMGLKSTETTVVLASKHAVMDAFHDVLGLV